jgi:hypothetical protein
MVLQIGTVPRTELTMDVVGTNTTAASGQRTLRQGAGEEDGQA